MSSQTSWATSLPVSGVFIISVQGSITQSTPHIMICSTECNVLSVSTSDLITDHFSAVADSLSTYLSIPQSWGLLGHNTTWQPTFAIPLVPLLFSRRRQFQSRPIPDVIFPSFSLSASPSPSPYSALGDCLGKSQSSCDMPIPPHPVSLYGGQKFFVGSNGFPNPALHHFVGDVVFVRDAKETS